MRCFLCPNPAAHPATGSELRPGVLVCEDCTRRFWSWFRGHMRAWSRPGRPDFYAAAGKHKTKTPPRSEDRGGEGDP